MVNKKLSRGLSIIELVLATAIISAFLIAVIFSFTSLLKLAFSNVKTVKAVFLAEEGVEVVKYLKDVSWENNINLLVSNGTKGYHLNFTGLGWEISEDNIFIDGSFERIFVLENVYRDESSGQIVESGGSLDAGAKKLTVYISWLSGGATSTRYISTYIADI
jgi:hypothetical protein